MLGVIEIPSFYFDYRSRRAGKQYRSVSEDTANAFEALKAKKVEGIIIDLRNDPWLIRRSCTYVGTGD